MEGDRPGWPTGREIATARTVKRHVPGWNVPQAEVPPPSDWQRYLGSVARHKRVVLLVTLIGTLAGLVITQLLDARYSAKAILWIEADRPADAARSTIASEGIVGPAAWSELVTSNAVLDSAVRQLRLYVEPRAAADSVALTGFRIGSRVLPGEYVLAVDREAHSFELKLDDGTVVQRGVVGQRIGEAAGFVWQPPARVLQPRREIEFTVVSPYEAVQKLAKDLDIHLDPGGSFLSLELKGTSAWLTAATVNAVSDRVVAVAADLKRGKYREISEILGEQYAHAERTLNSAEASLRNFRVRTADRATRAHAAAAAADPTLTRAIEMQLAIDDVQRDQRAIEGALRNPTARRLEALAVIPAVQASPQLTQALEEVTLRRSELRTLRNRYTDESAPVQELSAGLQALEERTIPELAQQLAAELATRNTALDTRRDAAVGDLREIPALTMEEARLQRDVASAEELFSNVRQRFEATRLAVLSSLPDIRVLDAAVQPQSPMRDFAPLLVLLSFMTSLGFGVFGVTIMDRVDPRVRHPEQVTRGMQLDILGAVPRARWSLRSQQNPAEVIEALRGLRMRVLQAHASDGPLLLTVTSTSAGEGKSFVSVNLALSFAHAGYETLLIDGDVRRGTLHRVLELPRRPGLTDVLAGAVALDSTVQNTKHPGLSLVASGTWTEHAPELLMSSRLRELVARLRGRFGVIIIDTPPLSAGTDPLVLATVTGKLLFVVRSGMTDLALAAAKLDVVDSFPVHTIGAVLNEVRSSDSFSYYTYDLSEYGQPDEEAIVTGHGGPQRILGGRP